MNSYKIIEKEVGKDNVLYPRIVYQIVKTGKRLVEKKFYDAEEEKYHTYGWEEYEEPLMSYYLTELSAIKMLNKRIERETPISEYNPHFSPLSVPVGIPRGSINEWGKIKIDEKENKQ